MAHPSHGAVSASQLTLYTFWVAGAEGNLREVMDRFTEPNPQYDGDETHDDKVDKAFDFMRFWIDHNHPPAGACPGRGQDC